jgi:general secretion pathway protein F
MAIKSPTLDDLIALNDQIAALVRAGIPLERGLEEVAKDLPGRSGRLAGRIAERTERGASLVEAIDAEGERLPALYRAVVAAGLRTGRLEAALEGLADTARRVADLRRATGLALVYPLVVVAAAWLLMGVAVFFILPRLRGMASGGLTLELSPVNVRTLLMVAALLVLGIVAATAAVWWWRGRTAGAFGVAREHSKGGFGRLVSIRRVRRLSQAAAFADFLALSIEQGVPLADALELAAGAAGADWLKLPAARLAADVRAGRRVSESRACVDGFPALIRLGLLCDRDHAPMVDSLTGAAEAYRLRADQDADWLMLRIPVLLTLVLGGGTVAAYAAIVFGPYISMLHSMSSWL